MISSRGESSEFFDGEVLDTTVAISMTNGVEIANKKMLLENKVTSKHLFNYNYQF